MGRLMPRLWSIEAPVIRGHGYTVGCCFSFFRFWLARSSALIYDDEFHPWRVCVAILRSAVISSAHDFVGIMMLVVN